MGRLIPVTEASNFLCDHHATWDAQLQPTGPACGELAAYAIVWTESNQVSYACVPHAKDIDWRAPKHTVVPLPGAIFTSEGPA